MSVDGSEMEQAGIAPALTDAPRVTDAPAAAPNILIASKVVAWEDLKARSIPDEWLEMSPILQPTISMMQVQTPTGPRLVNADTGGNIGVTNPRSSVPPWSVNVNSQDSVTLQVPPGAQVLHLMLDNLPATIANIAVQGLNSGHVYAQMGIPGQIPAESYVPISYELDQQLLVSITLNAGVPGAATVNAEFITGNALSFPQESVGVPLPVSVPNPLPVSQPATPTLWQAPNQPPLAIEAVLAKSTPLTLVAGVAGQTLRLFGLEVAPDAAGANFVEFYKSSTPGTHLWQAQFNQLNPRHINFGGAPLPVGDGLVVNNDAASAGPVTLRGALTYSQG